MKDSKLLSLLILPTIFLFACSGNTTANSGKDSTSTTTSSAPGSGDDLYYELTTTSTSKDMNITGITKMFVSSKGDMRTEMAMNNSMSANKNKSPMILIGHSDKPNENILIDDSAKTYSINHIDKNDLANNGEKTQSTVTKIDDEKIMGFNCVHVRIFSTKTIGSFYSSKDTTDLWRSNDVPMQSSVKKLFEDFESRTGNFMYSKETSDHIKQMGCEGFTVKFTMNSKDVAMVMQLTKVEHRDLPGNMFAIPAGYTEDKNGL